MRVDEMTSADEMRQAGVAFAATAAGHDLPVLDVTHPRFALADDAAGMAALHDRLEAAERQNRRLPEFLLRFLLRQAARKSRPAAAMFGGEGAFLDGMSTYALKLGGANLVPPYDSPTDRRFADAPHCLFMRLRSQQVAKLLAGGLAADLPAAGSRALRLLNIGGGPAIDSLNALILLARDHPALMERKITIHVLDRDEAGPAFGRNALAAMMAPGRKLAGFDIAFQHQPYDWNDPHLLERLMEELAGARAVVAASSEGGLFEYGNDAAIVANLQALHNDGHGARLVAGSVTRGDEMRKRLIGATRFRIVPRGLSGFAPLAERGFYRIETSLGGALSDQVRLRPV
jgi:hypothetical protein